jgi:cell wall-associated NlpC family hydrolase
MKPLIDYAEKFYGVPYKWGGENPMQGFDCSGFIQWIFRSIGMDPRGDQTAQVYYSYFSNRGNRLPTPEKGALLFFGVNSEKISHIALAISSYQMIEAGGGDRTTVSYDDAFNNGACVRKNIISARQDFIAAVMPHYPQWLLEAT